MITDTEIAWAAGLFEGEGTMYQRLPSKDGSRSKGSRTKVPIFQLKMTDEDAVRQFARIVEVGRVNGPYGPYEAQSLPWWMWRAQKWPDIRHVAELLGPYFMARRSIRLAELMARDPQLHQIRLEIL